jgi:restriction system protein
LNRLERSLTLHFAFAAAPGALVGTVVFNGMVDQIDPATGQPVRKCLITLRATREHFDEINLSNVDPDACVRRHFAAEVSDHPEAVAPVEPFLNFDMTDPRIVDPVDIISELDRRPNLMDMSPKDFENFIQNENGSADGRTRSLRRGARPGRYEGNPDHDERIRPIQPRVRQRQAAAAI